MNVSDIDEECESAIVHGVMTELSPVKSSSGNPKVKYFTGKMSDGNKTVRVVSFDPALRPRFAESLENSKAIALSNCKVQGTQSKATNCTYELVASTKRSTVVKYDKEFNIPEDMTEVDPDVAKNITLSGLPNCIVNQYVNVQVKMLETSPPVIVESKKQTWMELRKQDTIVADATGTTRLVLWQADIGMLQENHSYKVPDAHVRMYDEVYYLSVSEKWEICEIPDIGDVQVIDESQKSSLCVGGVGIVIIGKVLSVASSEEYTSCVMCFCKLLDSSTNVVQCDKCGAKMRKENCSRSELAKVIIESLNPSGRLQAKEQFRATIFDNVLSMMVGAEGRDPDTELLEAPWFEFKIKKNVVYSAKPV